MAASQSIAAMSGPRTKCAKNPRPKAAVTSSQMRRGRGLVRLFPVGRALHRPGGGAVIVSGGQPVGADLSEDEDDGGLKPLPERLIMELTAHRTLALREAIGRSPDADVALTLLLTKLVTDTFRSSKAAAGCPKFCAAPIWSRWTAKKSQRGRGVTRFSPRRPIFRHF